MAFDLVRVQSPPMNSGLDCKDARHDSASPTFWYIGRCLADNGLQVQSESKDQSYLSIIPCQQLLYPPHQGVG